MHINNGSKDDFTEIMKTHGCVSEHIVNFSSPPIYPAGVEVINAWPQSLKFVQDYA